MLEDFQGYSWGSIPPLRMSSLVPHDLCHGRSASRRPPTMFSYESFLILYFQQMSRFSDPFEKVADYSKLHSPPTPIPQVKFDWSWVAAASLQPGLSSLVCHSAPDSLLCTPGCLLSFMFLLGLPWHFSVQPLASYYCYILKMRHKHFREAVMKYVGMQRWSRVNRPGTQMAYRTCRMTLAEAT